MPSIDPQAIGKAFRLERRDRARAARALGWLIVATAALRIFSYDRLIRLASRLPSSARALLSPSECAVAVRRAARVWPAQCLPQAVAGYCLLRRGGRTPAITLGVAREGERFDAHAWLDCDGVTVTGASERLYSPLAGAGRRPS